MTHDGLLGRIERTSVIAEVMNRIRRLITSGELAPGERLPSERELRERLGVGRSTIREALRALEALGLIDIRQGQGAYVRVAVDPESTPTGQSIENWAQLDRVVEARLPIETYAAALAALRRTDDRLAELSKKLDEFEYAMIRNDLSKAVLADFEFHNLIADAASPVLVSCLDSIGVLLINSRRTSLSRSERLPHVLEKHRLIYDAIAAQDPVKASQSMSEHLLDFISELGFRVGTLDPSGVKGLVGGAHYILGPANREVGSELLRPSSQVN
jgi:GntR family transcriptional repressor for pyruvate dehydrogenase complex